MIHEDTRRDTKECVLFVPLRVISWILYQRSPPELLGLGHTGEGHKIGHREVSSRYRGKNRREPARDI
jgi:hypothetical protein